MVDSLTQGYFMLVYGLRTVLPYYLRRIPQGVHFIECHIVERFISVGFNVFEARFKFAVGAFEGGFGVDAFKTSIVDECE